MANTSLQTKELMESISKYYRPFTFYNLSKISINLRGRIKKEKEKSTTAAGEIASTNFRSTIKQKGLGTRSV